ncbi:MAG: PLP-dependent aminotransferase family protein [Treponema sp.]|nr:PLP-dependent aminotransferase family protein [Treponema sp.]
MTIYRQIYNKIIDEIRSGKLKPGQKITSIRKYADENGISCNSVQNAYNQLLQEGYIYSQEKKGFFVADFDENLIELTNKVLFNTEIQAKNDEARIAEVEKRKEQLKKEELSETGKINLSANLTDSAIFPYDTLRRLYRRVLSSKNKSILEETGSFRGDMELRTAIADYLYKHRGVNCNASQILIGGGTAALMGQLINLFKVLEKDEKKLNQKRPSSINFFIENPCYEKTRRIIESEDCKIINLPMDENGANIPNSTEALAQNSEGPDILHITPSHQFPLGITMPVTRRTELLNWANEKENRFIIEDDYDSEFRYKGHQIPAMQSMDTKGRVIYLGTFSRTLTPSIRINYVLLPIKLSKLYDKYFNYYSCPVPRIEQEVLSIFINEGFFERHINRAKKIYKARHDLMIEELEKNIPNCHLSGTQAGLHFILKVKDEKSFIEKAAQENLIIQGSGNGAVIIGYGHLKEKEIIKAAKTISKICLLQ